MNGNVATRQSIDGSARESGLIGWAERGLIPDPLLRMGIRRLCAQRLADERAGGAEVVSQRFQILLDELRSSPVALRSDVADRLPQELPPRFFELCLGPRLKYSSCYFPTGRESLEQAEEAMLELYGERAQLADGQNILELGCGWGALTLWMAERFPGANITALCGSALQRRYIEERCEALGLDNVRVMAEDMNRLQLIPGDYDRVISVEMFEHLRNYETLLARIAGWLRPGGTLFVHMFCHRELMYRFEPRGENGWMGRHFFNGGLMPATDTLLHFQNQMLLERQWRLSGRHYQRSANAWLANHDRRSKEVLEVLADTYGADAASLWHQRWRMFWMACAELFGFNDGDEWLLAHYRFTRR